MGTGPEGVDGWIQSMGGLESWTDPTLPTEYTWKMGLMGLTEAEKRITKCRNSLLSDVSMEPANSYCMD